MVDMILYKKLYFHESLYGMFNDMSCLYDSGTWSLHTRVGYWYGQPVEREAMSVLIGIIYNN